MIEEAQIVLQKAHQLNLLLDLADADLLPGEDGAEADLALADADAPAMGHGDGAGIWSTWSSLARKSCNFRVPLP
ncbi:MAG: hypothetical protein ACREUL_05545 [Steroidobacteraceae bacterium]